MIAYTAWYKSIKGFRWHKIKRVTGDWSADGMKILDCENEEQYQFPMGKYIFRFSKERYRSIEKRMSRQAGQQIQTDRR